MVPYVGSADALLGGSAVACDLLRKQRPGPVALSVQRHHHQSCASLTGRHWYPLVVPEIRWSVETGMLSHKHFPWQLPIIFILRQSADNVFAPCTPQNAAVGQDGASLLLSHPCSAGQRRSATPGAQAHGAEGFVPRSTLGTLTPWPPPASLSPLGPKCQ